MRRSIAKRIARVVIDGAFKDFIQSTTPTMRTFLRAENARKKIDAALSGAPFSIGACIESGSHNRVSASDTSDLDLICQLLFHEIAIDGCLPPPTKILTDIAQHLRFRLPRHKVCIEKPSIVIKSPRTGLSIDLTPGIGCEPDPKKNAQIFAIPNENDQWIATSPDEMRLFGSAEQHRSRNRFYPTVRILKHWCWNATKRIHLSTIFVETVLMEAGCCHRWKTYSLIVGAAFGKIRKAIECPPLSPVWFKTAPPGALTTRTFLYPCAKDQVPQLIQCIDKVRSDIRIAAQNEAAGNYKDALLIWNKIFGDNFPQRHIRSVTNSPGTSRPESASLTTATSKPKAMQSSRDFDARSRDEIR